MFPPQHRVHRGVYDRDGGVPRRGTGNRVHGGFDVALGNVFWCADHALQGLGNFGPAQGVCNAGDVSLNLGVHRGHNLGSLVGAPEIDLVTVVLGWEALQVARSLQRRSRREWQQCPGQK